MLIESHRGSECGDPPNSWPAIERGHRLGADLIEVDVQVSRDGVSFLRHDYRLPDGRLARALDWDELAKLRIDGEPVPRLDDVLEWGRQLGTRFSLDVKSGFGAPRSALAEVAALAMRTRMEKQVLLLSWDHRALRDIKDAHPSLTTRALLRGRPVDLAAVLTNACVDAVSLSYDLAHESDVRVSQALGVAVCLVELFEPGFAAVDELAVDILGYGDPAAARAALSDGATDVSRW